MHIDSFVFLLLIVSSCMVSVPLGVLLVFWCLLGLGSFVFSLPSELGIVSDYKQNLASVLRGMLQS